MTYLEEDYNSKIPILQKQFGDIDPIMLKGLQHFLGYDMTKKYLTTFTQSLRHGKTEDEAYSLAEKVRGETANNNSTVKLYLETIIKNLN